MRFVLENVSQAYLDYSLQSRQADIQRGLDFVRDKIPGLEARVQELQGQLQELRQSNDLIDPASRGGQLSDQLNSFTQEQLTTQVELEQTRALYGDLRQQLSQRSQESAASSALGQNPRYQSLLNQLLEIDSQIAATSTLFYEDTDEIQLLREQRQNLLTLLEREGAQAEREVIGQIRTLEAREQALQETISNLNGGVDELSGLSRSYTDIQRELDVATENLSQFLTKREALQIDVAQREVPWELLTPPSEAEPIAASLARNLVLGTALGLLLGVGLAIVSDKFTDIVYTPEELKRLTGLPLLGIIPPNQELEELVPERESVALLQPAGAWQGDAPQNGSTRSYKVVRFLEAFRSLFANLRLLNLDTPIQSVVISSAIPGEGKSTIASCLAQAAAAMGQRVLLVDTDLRRPRVHEYLGLPNDRGITDMIVEGLNFSEVVQRSTLEPNLFVLTAGQTPPDPTRLLSSQKMQTFMQQVQNRFDFIIYDTPPLVGFADAYLLASHTSGLVLVTELGRLKRSSLEQAIEQSRVSSTPILGVVARSKKPLNF
ncbi:MAG: polysaccharide biosynthesis tyrosine autokinase [Leptolyngbyaceae cyanobacterium SL_7_1]|nr:polysaccharide biosynthesis tyrosine autokinase [Leptolyngbyaceae cyanobacterium SL_7_1]